MLPLDVARRMKPHFRYKARVWSCVSILEAGLSLGIRMGYGYTVGEAWEDWKQQGWSF